MFFASLRIFFKVKQTIELEDFIMLTIISFILTIIGSINWLLIGLLQYDFVAGIFGYQASVFSRIIYIIIGISSAILLFKLIKGKGVISVFSKNNKKDLKKNVDKVLTKSSNDQSYANSNVEAGRDEYYEREEPYSRSRGEHYDDGHHYHHRDSGLFDEHFDDNDRYN